MFKGTGLVVLELYQDRQAALKNKMGYFYEADLQKSYYQLQGNDDEIVIIASKLRQIGRNYRQVQRQRLPQASI